MTIKNEKTRAPKQRPSSQAFTPWQTPNFDKVVIVENTVYVYHYSEQCYVFHKKAYCIQDPHLMNVKIHINEERHDLKILNTGDKIHL